MTDGLESFLSSLAPSTPAPARRTMRRRRRPTLSPELRAFLDALGVPRRRGKRERVLLDAWVAARRWDSTRRRWRPTFRKFVEEQ
jgi:hypothetical protein